MSDNCASGYLVGQSACRGSLDSAGSHRHRTATSFACGVVISCMFRVGYVDGSGTIAGVTNAVTAVGLDAPTLTATSGVAAGTVDLSWTPPTSSLTITSYQIDRDAGSGFANLAIVPGNQTTYTDISCPPSTLCGYKIRAFYTSVRPATATRPPRCRPSTRRSPSRHRPLLRRATPRRPSAAARAARPATARRSQSRSTPARIPAARSRKPSTRRVLERRGPSTPPPWPTARIPRGEANELRIVAAHDHAGDVHRRHDRARRDADDGQRRDRRVPVHRQRDRASVGGACGTATGDSATVAVAIGGAATENGTATCTAGAWTYTLVTALSADGAYTASATQTDSVTNTGATGAKSITVDKGAPVVALTTVNAAFVTFPLHRQRHRRIGRRRLRHRCRRQHERLGRDRRRRQRERHRDLHRRQRGPTRLATALSADGAYTATATQSDSAGNTGTSGTQEHHDRQDRSRGHAHQGERVQRDVPVHRKRDRHVGGRHVRHRHR